MDLKQSHLHLKIQKGKATITGSVILSDYETGETLSILDGGFLTKVRTGAISGVATKYLAKENAKTLSVIGAGVQAEGLIEAILAVRDIEKFTSQVERSKKQKNLLKIYEIDLILK